jgi:hypothetical protein
MSQQEGRMKVGDIVRLGGYYTKARFFRGVSATEIERRIGYHSGRLARGWYLLFLLDPLQFSDFEVRGYSQMSGGVPQGHLPNPPDRRNSEQRLRAEGYDLDRIKKETVTDTFCLRGADRLAKVIPFAGEFGENDYPPGSGIPQWTLTTIKQFKVAAFVNAGDKYMGDYV